MTKTSRSIDLAATRRDFLRIASMPIGVAVLGGCGGAESAPSPAQEAAPAHDPAPSPDPGPAPSPAPPAPAPSPAPSPSPTPAPSPAPTGARQFTLVSPAGGTAPFAVGFPFKQGDIPSGSYVAASLAGVQATVKNRWPDGSVKFAIIAGQASLPAGVATAVELSATTSAPSGTPLGLADLRATGVTASIGCGSFGSANWTGADWDAPLQTWVSGPQMSCWIYRRQVGSDAHLVAWLEVRLYAGGSVEMLPWVENGYLRVASPTAKSATYTFALGGTQRFSAPINLLNHQRTPLLSGAALSYWLAGDPAVTPRHDAAYLQSTRLVPTYRATVSPSGGAVNSQPSTFSPLQQGSYPNGMGAAGYHSSIGILPEWDVLYLTSTSSSVWASLQRNAYSAGRYGIHFRDEGTNRPLRLSSYANLVLDGSSGVGSTGASSTNSYTPGASGGLPPTYVNSHAPAMGYLTYLLTGRVYHLETVQFQATVNFLKNTDSARQFSAGILRTDVGANTTRGAAWALRTLAHAAAITPDGDTLQTEFVGSVEANINYYHTRYVAQSNNPQGWVTPYSDYTGAGDNIYFEATWMQDFFTAAVGLTKALALPISSASAAKLDALFAWKARSIVGRFGSSAPNEYLYRDAAVYTIAVAPSDSPNFGSGAGPWFADWGSAYNATFASSPGPRTDGGLRGGNFPDATSYWGNLQPALSYAVEHGVPGALEAYNRMTSASNWNQLADGFNSDSVWSMRPR